MLKMSVVTMFVCAASAHAGEKSAVCTLLTEGEVTAALPLKPGAPLSHSEISEKPPFKGEKQERCNWPLGEGGKGGNLYLVTGTVKNADQRKATRASFDDLAKRAKAAGGATETKTFGEVSCLSALTAKQPTVVSCLTEKGGRGISLTAMLSGDLPAEKVKGLLDLAAGRVK
jgi:hypothetical protein